MPRILLTDDDPVQLKVQKLLLERAGHEVVAASGRMAALDEMDRGSPDLIIMDLRLLNSAGRPDANEGMALIRGIRERERARPVILLSGWPEQIYGRDEEKMVTRVMVKPVGPKDLLRAVAELVG